MVMLSILLFSSAFVAAVSVIAMSVAPQWGRIVRLATGHPELAFTPLQALVVAERRIAVRRWAASSAVALRPRAAA